MAKKSNLSSRELAAKKAGGSLDYKSGRITVAPKAAAKPRSVAPLMGAGPLQPGQKRALSNTMDTEGYTNDIYNALPSNSPAKLSASSNVGDVARSTAQRNMAARANKSKGGGGSSKPKSGFLSTVSDLAGSAGAALRNVPGFKQIGEYGDDYVNTGNRGSLGKVMAPFAVGAAIPAGMFAAGAGAAGGLSSLAGVGRGIIGRGMGNLGQGAKNTMGDIAEGAAARMPVSAIPAAGAGAVMASQLVGTQGNDPLFDPSFMGNGEGDANPSSPDQEIFRDTQPDNNPNRYREPTQEDNARNTGRDYETDTNAANSDMGDLNQWNVPTEADYSQQQNELYGGGPQQDVAPGRVTNQMRGSGMFGTGKGVGNPAGDDPYIKELRKAYSSNGGEKWLRQQFDELIKALDPTYSQMQKEGVDALNANLNNNSNQLASVMNAGNVGDSEQRTQQLAGLQNNNQTAIGALLAKLAQAKAGDVSQYKSSYAQQRGQLAEKNKTNQQRLLEQIQQYRNQQFNQNQAMMPKQYAPKKTTPPVTQKKTWVDPTTGDIYEYQD